MGETENKARMAEILSNDIFTVFGWLKVGPTNHNWKCVIDKHNKKTHPSDVVFRYMDPYENKAVYLNFDLKSYSRQSITKYTMSSAISSLVLSTECMQFSEEWNNAFQQPGEKVDKKSVLFIYNHDGEYDVNFHELVTSIDKDNFRLRKGNKVFFMGPRDVTYLKTIANDIEILRSRKVLPDADNCTFYYPDLDSKKVVNTRKAAATVEMLLGPWQIIQYKNDGKSGLIIYCKTSGETIDEFLYLIDYITHYQLLRSEDSINIRLPNSSNIAIGNYEKAILEYARLQEAPTLEERLMKIKAESVTNIVTKFSEIEIGMEG